VFDESDLVSPTLVEAIRSGEQSGQLGALLINISDFLDEENEVIVKSLTSILEPVILSVLGVVVGFIAISMFLPLFDLTSMAQGGH
jgi:type II secretory pathway component PulF